MSLRRLAPRFIDWRLSRIDEEVDRLSCSSEATTPPSPGLPPPPPSLLHDYPTLGRSSPGAGEPSADETLVLTVPGDDQGAGAGVVIYSNVEDWRKEQLERRAADEEQREALRFIKEKYDSLGKISVDKPTIGYQGLSEQNVLPTENGSRVDVAAEHRRVSAECVECQTEQALPTSQGTKPPGAAVAVQRRELKQTRLQHPPCQCQQRQEDAEDIERQQRQRLDVGECIPRTALSDGELTQIDLFYRSYKSCVYVCTCMATLSFSRPVLTVSAKSKLTPKLLDEYDDGVWACVRTGIPVIVRDNGDGRRRRRVYVLLAERGTGFELWRAPLDRLADYTATVASIPAGGSPSSACSQHTMRLSVDDRMSVTARLAFDDQAGADEFHRQLIRLATAADDAATAAGGQRKKKPHQKGVGSISKTAISQPCCFSHVTRLERGIPCRGRPGLHIVVASGCQMPPAAAVLPCSTSADSSHQRTTTSSNLRTASHQCHSSFKANYA